MNPALAREINRLLALSGAAALAALFLHSLWPLVAALLVYAGWHLHHLWQLYRWVARGAEEPPDNSGLWGELTQRLEQLFKREEQARGNLENTIERARESVNALAEGVILTDATGHLEYWNEAAARHLHFRGDADLGQPLTNLIRDPRFHRYFIQGDFSEPLELTAPADDNLILQFRITEFGPGDRLMLVRDISRMRHLEEMRKDFVANVSHELKTPLTVLRGWLETLDDTVPEEQNRVRRALEQMNQQSGRMQALVQDLLLLSRLESADPQEQKVAVPLHGMLQRLCEDARGLDPSKDPVIELDMPEDARLVGHPGELESALGNLLTNAVKYSHAEARIRVRYWQDGEGAHLAVEDDGMGIDPAHIPRLTERFYRPDNARAANVGGTGLGLAIVKHVLLRHDARLDIRSEPGKGSTFICHFPPSSLVDGPTVVASGSDP